VRGWDAYRDSIAAGRLPADDEETVDEEARLLERVWLGLRTDTGYPLADACEAELRLADRWRAGGWAHAGEDVLRLTAEGWLLLDRLAVELAAATEGRAALAGR
jgi:coproporphyrinogen III oxidase-like Fe-S oxidoreductase